MILHSKEELGMFLKRIEKAATDAKQVVSNTMIVAGMALVVAVVALIVSLVK